MFVALRNPFRRRHRQHAAEAAAAPGAAAAAPLPPPQPALPTVHATQSAPVELPASPAHARKRAGSVEDDEHVCRFCREGAEPDRPLIHPCACSGSMKFVHEDCMGLWIDRQEVARSRGESRCQTCGRAVRYAVVMLPGAPARLSHWQMLKIILENAAKQLPFASRAAVIMTSWALEVPLATGLIFLSFFHTAQTPPSLPATPQDFFQLMETGLLVFLVVGVVFFFVMHVFDVVRLYDEGVLDDEVEALRQARAGFEEPAHPRRVHRPLPQAAEPRAPVAALAAAPAAPVAGGVAANNDDDAAVAMALEDEGANEIDFEEWFGMRGPVHHLFMSQFVLGMCIVSTLLVGYACPASLGRQFASRLLRFGLFASTLDTCPNVDFTSTVCANPAALWTARAGDDNAAWVLLRRYAYEAVTLVLGLGSIKLTWDVAAVVLDWLAERVSDAHVQAVLFASSVCRSVSCVQKILALLFLRTVALPTLLGAVVLAGVMPLTTLDARWVAGFTASYPVPVLALMWVSGIAYILVVTMNIVLLREVIHPDIIEAVVRWRVPHNGNQLLPIIVEPTWVQLRRALVTWLGYVLSAVAFVVVPARALPVLPFTISWPRMVAIHMLGDVITFHLWLVNVLAQARPVLKTLQTAFFARASKLVGLYGFLVPQPVDAVAFAQAVRDDRNAQAPAHWLDPAPPLRADLLKPRARPRFVAVRMLVLIALAWATCLCVVGAFISTPLSMGYVLANAFVDVLPLQLTTDVRLVFALGWFVLGHAWTMAHKHVGRLQALAARSATRASCGRFALGAWMAVTVFAVAPMALGTTVCLLVRQEEPGESETEFVTMLVRALARQNAGKMWLVGAALEAGFVGMAAGGGLTELLARRSLWSASLRVNAAVAAWIVNTVFVLWLGHRLHAVLHVSALGASRWLAGMYVGYINLIVHGGATVQAANRAWQRLEKDLRNDRYFKGRRFLNFDEQR